MAFTRFEMDKCVMNGRPSEPQKETGGVMGVVILCADDAAVVV